MLVNILTIREATSRAGGRGNQELYGWMCSHSSHFSLKNIPTSDGLDMRCQLEKA